MKKVVIDEYISCVGDGAGGIEITDNEAEMLINMFASKHTAPEGYDYRLRADTFEWELVELPPMPEDDEEATAEDYENALGRFGV